MVSPSLNDRVLGCIVGGALGDAIGSCYEGVEPPQDLVIPDRLRISDDTQMTVATCESFVEHGVVTPKSVAEHFLRWHRGRRITGLGASTLKALTELEVGGHWATVGAVGERAAGNGAAMRIAPLAFVLDPDDDLQRQVIRDVCRITHRHDEAYLGALAIVRVIRNVLAGSSLDETLISSVVARLPDSRVRDRLHGLLNTSMTVRQYGDTFGATGYVVDSVPLAILAAVRSASFMSTVDSIVKCGGDTDTVASMFGQIFGAAHGIDSLPRDLVARIDAIEMIQNVASGFYSCVSLGS
ncbi:MAG: ADP-ribosylglycohydrolase family protein [Planctomycetota bacterium]